MTDTHLPYTFAKRLAYAARSLTIVRLIFFIVSVIVRSLRLVASLSWNIARVLTRRSPSAASADTFTKTLGRIVSETAEQGAAGLRKDLRAIRPELPSRPRSLAFGMVNFLLTVAIFIVPIFLYAQYRSLDSTRSRILDKTMGAVSSLFSAAGLLEEQKLPEANDAFSRAAGNFLEAQNELSAFNGLLLEAAKLLPSDTARQAGSSRHILAAGELSSRLGQKLTQAITTPPGQQPSVAVFIANFITRAEEALPDARQLEKEVAAIDPQAVPEPYRAQFTDLATKAAFLSGSLEEAVDLARQASVFLGDQTDKRYLLVFQNNSEMRGSGGFLGSYALVDLSRGEIKNLVVPKGGSYDTEAGLSRLVAAPEPLRLLNPLWHFWDANWWPDWPTSARKLQWFYENSNGPTVDGVISLTPDVIEGLIEVIGPIDLTKEYGVIITPENFWPVTQAFSEQKPAVTKEPKKIIGDLMTKIMEELPKRLTPDMTMKLVAMAETKLTQKQVLIYFNDRNLQASVKRFGWSGEIDRTDGDYLMVANSNIGGQKTDRVIRETLKHNAKILPDGSIVDTLTIIREHTGVKNELFTGVRNVNWLRAYVPQGSTLLSASGFAVPDAAYFQEADPAWELDEDLKSERAAATDPESGTKIYTEAGKTVFANWTMVDPGQTSVTTFTYRLPFSIAATEPDGWFDKLKQLIVIDRAERYSLLVQKQPGAATTALETSLETTLPTAWNYPADMEHEGAIWSYAAPLESDILTTFLFAH